MAPLPAANGHHSSTDISILNSFKRPLPILDTNTREWHSTKASGRTTSAMEIPRKWNQVPYTLYSDSAEDALHEAMQKNPVSMNRSTIEPVQSFFRSLHTEQDAVFACSWYLIHPVVIALNAVYPGVLVQASEYTEQLITRKDDSNEDAGDDGGTNDEEEESDEDEESDDDDGNGNGKKTGRIRYDLCFKINGKEIVAFIIEYKRRGQLVKDHFKLPQNDNPIRRKSPRPGVSAYYVQPVLQKSALVYTQQVCAYAAVSQCRYVALINWDHMALVKFSETDPENMNVGAAADLTFVEDDMDRSGEAPFKEVLFGFTHQAVQEKLSQLDGM